MNNKNIDYEYKKLCPFKWFVLENFPFIEADFDALTNWQLFCKLGKEMNKIITSVNSSGEQVEILTEAFNNLQNYVNNYFDNLDVQEEINNKLDKMVQDGTLQEIIANFLNSNALWCFNSVNDMKQAPNLIAGSFAKTLGYYKPDGNGSGLYKIRNKLSTDIVDNGKLIQLNNNLIAELITNYVDVKQYGAKGDGISDDTQFIQNAINNFNTIIFNKGNFLFTELSIKTNKKLIGKNSAVISGKSIIINGNNVTFEHIKYDGKNNSTGIKVRGANSVFDNCEIYNIKNNDNSLGVGIDILNTNNSIISNSYFHDFISGNEDASVGEDAGAIRCIRSYGSQKINIFNNKFEKLSGHKDGDIIHISSGTLGTIDNNFPYNGTRRANLQNIKIHNNTFIQEDCKSTIKVQASNVQICDNLFILNNKTDSQLAIIRVQNGDNNNISNNDFQVTQEVNFNHIIYYENTANSIINNNNFDIDITDNVDGTSSQNLFRVLRTKNIKYINNNINCKDIRYINYWDGNEDLLYKNNNIKLTNTKNSRPTFIRILNTINHTSNNIDVIENNYNEFYEDENVSQQSFLQITDINNCNFLNNELTISRYGNITNISNLNNFNFKYNKIKNINISDNVKYLICFLENCKNLDVRYNECNYNKQAFIRCINAITNLKFSANADYSRTTNPCIYKYTNNESELNYYESNFKSYNHDFGYNPDSINYQDGHIYYNRNGSLMCYYNGSWKSYSPA